jgi:four helix bundle protein
MKVARFEDLEIWKLSRELCKVVFEITSSGPFNHDYRFRDQIKAASGSAMDNIAEGFNREGNKEFCQFLYIVLGSIGEVRSQSYRAFDWNYISEEKFNDMMERTDAICRKTYNLIQHLKDSDSKGIKFR